MEVSVSTDNWSNENSWDIVDSAGTVVASRDSFATDYTDYKDDVCLDKTECYTFTFKDSWGDGLGSDGHFKLEVDGQLLLD